ncbi:secreted RxLR effector protein 161-like [Nicotiana sylvestris]|uniref:secreted RxLR effector protein 161-like n=1 Tax=Nicotiana sylvestris TaxID=4096 RepID=UPI00388C86AE
MAYALGVTSRYLANPCEEHWKVVKTILKYLRRTKDQFLIYGILMSWKSSKQATVADSVIEAEYIAASEAAKETV